MAAALMVALVFVWQHSMSRTASVETRPVQAVAKGDGARWAEPDESGWAAAEVFAVRHTLARHTDRLSTAAERPPPLVLPAITAPSMPDRPAAATVAEPGVPAAVAVRAGAAGSHTDVEQRAAGAIGGDVDAFESLIGLFASPGPRAVGGASVEGSNGPARQ
jgi:hypothetical protein